ncbi:MAG: inorganic phosphate transporter [Candidatus Paceibacterota bacterium]|jgi:PiT family inorganic phosphate transporter
MEPFIFIIIIVLLAWIYDFWNGANDCANSIATVVSTRAMSFRKAILMTGFFNFFGAFVSTEVAKTIGKGIVDPAAITTGIIISGLLGAIIWTIASTQFGLPISVTHALIGGLIGAGVASGGFGVLRTDGLIKIVQGIFGSPLISFFAAGLFFVFLVWVLKLFFQKMPAFKLNNFFRRGQVLTSLAVSFTHGMNDTQNAMGIITIALVSGGYLADFNVPLWVIAGSGTFMALGTIWGGHRVIKTVGQKIYDLKPVHGFATEFSSAVLIYFQSLGGIPLSTTQVVTAGVMGVGSTEHKSQVQWKKVNEIFLTWVLTIPGSAAIGAVLFFVLRNFVR